MKKAYILDYGCGNVKSLEYFLQKLGLKCDETNSPENIVNGDLLVLPGVGSFGVAKNNLDISGNLDALHCRINLDKPTLGICLGFQLLTESSEESNNQSGLGIFNAKTIKMSEGPEIGWKQVEPLPSLYSSSSIYFFNHSFGVIAHGDQFDFSLVSHSQYLAFARNSMTVGVQFHPEKSQISGQNFITRVMQEVWGQ